MIQATHIRSRRRQTLARLSALDCRHTPDRKALGRTPSSTEEQLKASVKSVQTLLKAGAPARTRGHSLATIRCRPLRLRPTCRLASLGSSSLTVHRGAQGALSEGVGSSSPGQLVQDRFRRRGSRAQWRSHNGAGGDPRIFCQLDSISDRKPSSLKEHWPKTHYSVVERLSDLLTSYPSKDRSPLAGQAMRSRSKARTSRPSKPPHRPSLMRNRAN